MLFKYGFKKRITRIGNHQKRIFESKRFFSRRVVVTGFGMVTGFGNKVKDTVDGVFGAKSCIRRIQWSEEHLKIYGKEILDSIPSQVAGQVEGHWGSQTQSRFQQFAITAAREAIESSKLLESSLSRKRIGVAMGAGVCSLDDIVESHETLRTRGPRKLSAYFVPRMLTNLAAGHIAIEFGLCGPIHSASTACATGAHSIGDAFSLIRHGQADAMLCGGSEASIHPLSVSGFSRMKALSTKFNSTPEKASRPFDMQRDGFVIAEGAGVVVLEELNHARKRGAQIFAELAGFGYASDAFHLTAPDPNGSGALQAMTACLASQTLINASDVGYVNAHATSTPMGDEIELLALKQLFSSPLIVSSTKGATGHLLGAAGAVEAILSIHSLMRLEIPPNLNLENPISSDFILPVHHSLPSPSLKAVLSNSFGFGGFNSSLLFLNSNFIK